MNNEKNGVGLALSGGGSRAIAFHYGVLETLHEFKIVQKVNVVSAISGGAIIGALFNLCFQDWGKFSQKVEMILREGLQASLYRKIFDLKLMFWQGLHPDSFAEILDRKLFSGIKLNDIPEKPTLILNATDLKTGSNFKFGKAYCGSYREGSYSLPGLRLSQAVAYSAAFTLFFSVKKLKLDGDKVAYLTDGGVYDGLGANALMPDKDEKSILVQNCETIITSDASFPYQESPKGVDIFLRNRLESSYSCSTNRNRSLIYNKMYLLNRYKELPYLGTIKMDSKHDDMLTGWDKKDLGFINSYKTDFKPVTGKAIKLIKDRAKKATEIIVKKYLSHLL